MIGSLPLKSASVPMYRSLSANIKWNWRNEGKAGAVVKIKEIFINFRKYFCLPFGVIIIKMKIMLPSPAANS